MSSLIIVYLPLVNGLKKGEKYVFRVAAKNEAGVGEPCQATRPILCKPKYDAPDAPGTPKVDDVDKDHVDISWTAPIKDGGSRITGYVVEKKKLGDDDWTPATTAPVTGQDARIEGLEEGQDYEFRVRAVNAAGPGQPSFASEMTNVCKKKTKPQSPEEVTVKDIRANSCTVEWEPPRSDGGLPVTGYVVEKCDESTGVWERVPGAIKGNSVDVADLTEGKRYKFRVSAVNPLGVSEPTETLLSIVAKNPFDTPDAPQGVKVKDYDRSSVTLAWKPPDGDGGNPIKGYQVEKRTPKGTWEKALPGLVTGTEAIIPNLETGKEVEFRVAAVNDGGPGDFSRPTMPHLVRDKIAPASAPQDLNVDKVTKNGTRLSWKKPKSDGGSKVTGYVVEKKNEDGEWEPVKQTTEPEVFVPMKEGEKAQFRVRAVNEEGEGEPSRPTPLITAEDQPAPPRIAMPADGLSNVPNSGIGGLKDVTIRAGNDLRLPVTWFGSPTPTASWLHNGRPVVPDGKRAKVTTEEAPHSATPLLGGHLEEDPAGTSVLIVPKVRREDSGSYQVQLQNPLGQVTSSCSVVVLDAPASPTGPLEATDISANEITLQWKPPADDGGDPVKNYILEKKVPGSDKWQTVSAFLRTPTATVRNLEEGQPYEFRVMAENSYGVSEPLMTTSAIKPKHPFDTPSGMSEPVVEEVTDDSVTLSWDKPTHGPVSGYTVEKRPKGAREWAKANLGNITGTSYTVKGLPTGQEFEFRVVPHNAAGVGEPSDPTPFVKVQKPTEAPKIGKDSPSEVNAVLGQPLKIRIPYTGSPPDTVELIKDGKQVIIPNQHLKVEITPDEVVITAPAAEKSDSGIYDVKLKNDKGDDHLPIKINVLCPPDAPEGPLDVSNVTANSCKLAWKPPTNNGGAPITNYVVEKQDPTTGEWTPLSRFVRQPEYEVTSLEEGKKYKFRVRAANEYGVGEPLEASRAITAEDEAVTPDAPSGLEVADVDSDSVTLEWVKPSGIGKKKPTGYVVEYKSPEDDEWVRAPTGPIKGTTANVPNLEKGKRYIFRVAAKNDAGVGEPSRPTRPVECKPKYTAPGAPGVPSVDSVGRDFVNLSWPTPTRDGGSRITGYQVEKRRRNSPDWEPATSNLIVGNSANISGLPTDEEFEFRVIPVNAAGPGEPSQPTPMTKIQDRKGGAAADFITKVTPVSASIGGTAEFKVQVDGNPLPKVRWFRNGIELKPNSRCRMTGPDEDGFARLILDDLDEHDNGEITCEISTPVNRVSCSAPLEVYGAPRVLGEVPEKTAEEGDLVKFKVPFIGKGDISLKLKKDGREVPESNNVKLMDLDGIASVQLKDVDRSMAGPYTLEISNNSGTTSVPLSLRILGPPDSCQGPLVASDTTPYSTRLTWRPPRNDGGSKVTHYVVERQEVGKDNWVTVQSACTTPTCEIQGLQELASYNFRVAPVNDVGQGDWLVTSTPVVAKYPFDKPSAPGPLTVSEVGSNYVNLTWSRPASDGGGRLQGYIVEKREVGAPNWTRVNVNPILSLSVNLPNLIEDKSYEFRVLAVNEAGESPPSQTDRPVLIKDPLSCAVPTLVRPLKAVTVNEGRDAVLEVEVDCSSPFDVTWYKGDRELVPSHRIDMVREGRVCSLTINDCAGEDTDEYSVRLSNRGGTKVSRAPLTVQTKPRINLPTRWQEPSDWERGDTIQIKVPFVANPMPKATWKLNGKELKEGRNVSMEMKRRHAILTLKNVDENNSGDIEVILENPMGSDSAKINLRVHDRPPPPTDVRVEGTSDGSALLSWKMPPDSGYVSEYIVERSEGPEDKWIRAGVSRFATYSCEGLENGKEYRFRVYADNLHGRSEPSLPSSPVTITPSENDRTRGRDGRKRGNYDGPPVNDYDRLYENIWRNGAPAPTNVNSGSIYDYYDILEELGRGTFGTVYRCKEKATGRIYVAKFVDTPTDAERQAVRNEINIMKQLNHPKLLHLHEAFEEPDETAMVLEFISGGELFDRIADDGYNMNEAEAIKYIRQVLEGLQHMHENNIVHLDIKPENIMCETSKSTDIKLVDFGLSAKLNPNEEVRVCTATPEFAAPEIADHNPVGFYTDMWSVGVLSYILLSGLSPFSGQDTNETLMNVSRGTYDFNDEAFNNVSDNAKDFISKLLQKQPEKRMTVFDALNHPWLNSAITEDQRRRIPGKRYNRVREEMHRRIGKVKDSWPPISHIANYSSIRRLGRDKHIYSTQFDYREAGPRFVRHPHNQIVREGNTAQFDCRVIGVSEPIVTWTYRGVQLPQSIKYMQRHSGYDFSLKVSRTKKSDDEGEYFVRAENSFGRKESSAYLTVDYVREVTQEPPPPPKKKFELKTYEVWTEEEYQPRFSRMLQNRFVQDGSHVKLMCTADGNPTPTLTWYKDGREIGRDSTDYTVQTMLGITSLEIYSCSERHSGKYVCRATNSRGEDETSCKLVVEPNRVKKLLAATSNFRGMRSTSQQPTMINETTSWRETSVSGDTTVTRSYYSSRRVDRITSEIREMSPQQKAPTLVEALESPFDLREGDRLALVAKFTEAIPPAKIAWFIDGQEVRNDPRVSIETQEGARRSRLVIDEVAASDAGDYECRASNPAGVAKTRVTVDIQRSKKNLSQTVAEENTVNTHYSNYEELADNGQLLTLPVDSNQLLEDSAGPIEEDSAYSLRMNSVSKVLTSLEETDHAETTVPEDEEEERPPTGMAGLDLGAPLDLPILVRHLQGQICDVGSSVQFSCAFKNEVGLGWFFNGRPLAPSDRCSMTANDGVVDLELSDLCLNDSGIYSCYAFGNQGKIYTVAYLHVRDPNNPPLAPEFITFPESMTITADSPIEINCTFTKPVEHVMMCQNELEMEEAVIELGDGGLSVKVSLAGGELVPADTGKYAIIAQDANGASAEWWFSIEILHSNS
ncbi:hypothetical protein AAHC03_04779 [Spirometra sp. Aus1]